jgi:hypothetical protein
MENALEKLAEDAFVSIQAWCESRDFSIPFVRAITNADIPEEEKRVLIGDAVVIGNAAYYADNVDSDIEYDGLKLSRLAQPGKYSDKTIKTVLDLMKEHLDNRHGYMRHYMAEFDNMLDVSRRQLQLL